MHNYPFLMGQGVWLDSDKLGPDDEVGEVLKHGTLSIGFIGLAETPQGARPACTTAKATRSQKLGLEIIGYMRKRMRRGNRRKPTMNFTLLATPAEGLSGRFVRMDQKRYRHRSPASPIVSTTPTASISRFTIRISALMTRSGWRRPIMR